MSLFPANFGTKGRSIKLEPVTLRGFGGGWNTVDDDISMQPRFCVDLKNMKRTPSGGQELRYGTSFFASVASVVSGTIIDTEYFNDYEIVVMSSGEIAAVSSAGVAYVIWNAALAAAQPGAPDGWHNGVTSVDFVPFRTSLVLHNGVDKPLEIQSNLSVRYLQDLATGSNANTPIGRYGCVANNYHCVAGITNYETTVYIASKGTIGTFPGDTAPNDSISIDVGAYVPEGGEAIRGIAGYRTYLLIFFRAQTLIMTLGQYDADGNHTPVPSDTLPQFGLLGHRCLVPVNNDLVFADRNGINTAKRNLFSGSVDSNELSALIAPTYREIIGGLTEDQVLYSAFMTLDKIANEVRLHSPEGTVFVRSADDKLRYNAWSYWQGLDFTCANSTFLGRTILGKGTKLFYLGNKSFSGDNFHADLLNDRDGTWANATAYAAGFMAWDDIESKSFTCLVDHTSSLAGTFAEDRALHTANWQEYTGEDIAFRLETPWLDGHAPMQDKLIRYLTVLTKGSAQFTVEAYVDNLYKDEAGDIVHDPALSMDFVGNDTGGYGFDAPFGGGRKAGDPRLYRYPAKFKMIKFVISGSTKKPLNIVGLSFLFSRGMYKR